MSVHSPRPWAPFLRPRSSPNDRERVAQTTIIRRQSEPIWTTRLFNKKQLGSSNQAHRVCTISVRLKSLQASSPPASTLKNATAPIAGGVSKCLTGHGLARFTFPSRRKVTSWIAKRTKNRRARLQSRCDKTFK